jgi:hypothetical protein
LQHALLADDRGDVPRDRVSDHAISRDVSCRQTSRLFN